MAWSGAWTAIIWIIGKKLGYIRCPAYEEIIGMDYCKHTGTMSNPEKEFLKGKIDEYL